MSTAEQKLAAIIAILNEPSSDSVVAPGPGIGEPDPQPPAKTPWYRNASTPSPTFPLENVFDVEAIKDYAAHGYRTNLRVGVALQDWEAALTKADAIAASWSSIGNVGSYDIDTAILLVIGGGTQGGGVMGPEVIYAPTGLSFTQAAAWLAAEPGTAGPSGR